MSRNIEIAREIFRHIGGIDFVIKTRAMNFHILEDGLQFDIRQTPESAPDAISRIKIERDPSLTYSMTASRKIQSNHEPIKFETGLYDDMIQYYFSEFTGIEIF